MRSQMNRITHDPSGQVFLAVGALGLALWLALIITVIF